MIKLNGHKNSTISFDVDVKNKGKDELKGFFRLTFESIEYGFNVDLAGGKAKVVIPALRDVISNITEESVLETRLEFVGGGDHVQAWTDQAEIFLPPEVNAVVNEEEEDKLKVTITEVDDEKIVAAKAKLIEDKKTAKTKTPKKTNKSKKKLSMTSRFMGMLDD